MRYGTVSEYNILDFDSSYYFCVGWAPNTVPGTVMIKVPANTGTVPGTRAPWLPTRYPTRVLYRTVYSTGYPKPVLYPYR
jgi:hypothetical protein